MSTSKYRNEDVTRRVIPAILDDVTVMANDDAGLETLVVIYTRRNEGDLYFDYAGVSDNTAIVHMLCAARDVEAKMAEELRVKGMTTHRLLLEDRAVRNRLGLGDDQRS
jgi:hypothetical protein